MKFKAAILEESHKPLVVDEVQFDDILGIGHVLAKVLYTTICGAQLNEIDAIKGPDKYLPHLLGHEALALVEDTGPGVRRVKKNDLVVLHWRPAAGLLGDSPRICRGTQRIKAGPVTTFSEYTVVSENRCTPVPDSEHNKDMPLFGCAVTTAFGAVCNDARVRIGDSVLVIGVGGVGACVLQMAKLAGAANIVTVDVEPDKVALAPVYGATHSIFYNRLYDIEELSVDVRDALGTDHADIVIETTGKEQMLEFAYDIARSDGACISVGVQKGPVSINPLKLKDGMKFTQSHGGNCQPDRDIPRLFNMLQEGRFKLTGMIQKTVSLDNINEGIEYMRSGGVGRVLVDMGALS